MGGRTVAAPEATGTAGTAAGASARARYRTLVARRRKWRATAALLAVAAAAVAWLLFAGGAVRAGSAAVVVTGAVVWVGTRVGRDVERWDRGASGERSTAVLLSGLARGRGGRPGRWVVRHDLAVPGSRANIDHVVVGRTGVWVVDTKTTRTRVRAGLWTVRFGGRRLDTGPVRWEARVVGDRLAAAGLDVPVRPLVAVHGSGLRRRGGRAGGVPVVPAGSLVRRVRKGRRRLRRAQVVEVASALDRWFGPAWEPGPRPPVLVGRKAGSPVGPGAGRQASRRSQGSRG